MDKHIKCEVCGTPCRVVGKTTMHYEPLYREEIEKLKKEPDTFTSTQAKDMLKKDFFPIEPLKNEASNKKMETRVLDKINEIIDRLNHNELCKHRARKILPEHLAKEADEK